MGQYLRVGHVRHPSNAETTSAVAMALDQETVTVILRVAFRGIYVKH